MNHLVKHLVKQTIVRYDRHRRLTTTVGGGGRRSPTLQDHHAWNDLMKFIIKEECATEQSRKIKDNRAAVTTLLVCMGVRGRN